MAGLQQVNQLRHDNCDFFEFIYENPTSWLKGYFTGDETGLVAIVANHFIVAPDDCDNWKGVFYPNEELNISIAAADSTRQLFYRIAGLDKSHSLPNYSVMKRLYTIAPYVGRQLPAILKERDLVHAACWRDRKDFPKLMDLMKARKSTRQKRTVYLWSAAK